MNTRKIWTAFFTMIACACFFVSAAQPAVKTSVDKNEILIGEQFNLKIEADFSSEEYSVKWPAIPDSLRHFEIVGKAKTDSLYSDRQLTGIIKTFTLTSFDSGKWLLPSFLVGFTPAKGDTTISSFTDSLPVTVSFAAADSTGQLRDIKPVRDVPAANHLWYWIIGGLLLIILCGLLTWWLKRRKKTVMHPNQKTRITPYDEAMQELDGLKKYNLTNAADIKIVHTRVAEIFKHYLSRRQNNNYDTKTTGDVLILVSDQFSSPAILAQTAASLSCSDAVKFAKYLPAADETALSIQAMRDAINDIHQKTVLTTGSQTKA